MQQHLGGAVGASERPGDLPVVHPQREAHDQRLAAVIGQLLDPGEDRLELLAALDQRLGGVRRRDHPRVLDRRLRLAGAVTVEVGRQVVRDADEPRPQRPAVGFAQRPLEVAVGLQKRLLGEVLGIVVVADPVVAVGVDVAQVGAVELGEPGVELRLVLGVPSSTAWEPISVQAARTARARLRRPAG